MSGIEKLEEDPNLEDVCTSVEGIVKELLGKEHKLSGLGFASIFNDLYRDAFLNKNIKSTLAIKCIRSHLNEWFFEYKEFSSIGIIIHSFMLQYVSLTLKIKLMAENALKWADNIKFETISFENTVELLEKMPVVTSDYYIAKDDAIIDELSKIWTKEIRYEALKDFYLENIRKLVENNDQSGKIAILVFERYFFEIVTKSVDIGELFINLAKVFIVNILKFEMWIENFIGRIENPKDEWTLMVNRRKSSFKERSLREVLSEYKKTKSE